ncbi:MBOAT family O-acyltransferase [Gemmatimonas groenlandica]|uniref:MBOAT family protein n=1 Tax=Gemmatimonas groenlandica TaxID=2732249 RepID=A0A6M4IQZ8_9BACT|nr:MBOAT family protein [Gemmatimonas groenlandica]
MPLLVLSILFNAAIAAAIRSSIDGRRKRFLVVGIVVNVSVLVLFKYTGFIADSASRVGLHLPAIKVAHFPLGLSFFTVQQIMMLIDCYERLVNIRTLRENFSFVAFFPSLLLGPIARARTMLPQLTGETWQPERTAEGLALLVLGLAKKVILADSLAVVSNAGFGTSTTWSTADAWLASTAYSLQLYFDFSGYSDMAIGAGLLLGIQLPLNFNVPFRSRSIAEFWQRWHMTLTSFINTYLFTPIIRSMGKATLSKSFIATFLSMLIAGLWHGPSWTYVLFGALHGIALIVNQYSKKRKLKLPSGVALVATLIFLNTAFIVFRAPSVRFAFDGIQSLIPFGARSFDLGAWTRELSLMPSVALMLAAGATSYFGPSSQELAKTLATGPATRRLALLFALSVVAMVMMTSGRQAQFVYNQF